MRTRLSQRIEALADWDRDQARQIFVEAILVDELGESIQQDPAFGRLVRKLSLQIGLDPELSGRLDTLLKRLKNDKTSI